MTIVARQEHSKDWLGLRQQVYTGVDDEFHRREIAIWLADPSRVCFITYRQNVPVGFIEVSQRNIVDGCLSSPVGYIEGIYVAPSERGKGLAQELLQTAEHWLIQHGCTEVATDAEIDNSNAISFHKAMGFRETFRIVEFKKSLEQNRI